MSEKTGIWRGFQLISFSDVGWIIALVMYSMKVFDAVDLSIERRIFLVFFAIAIMRRLLTYLAKDENTPKPPSRLPWQNGLLLLALILPCFLILLLAYLAMPDLHNNLGMITFGLGTLSALILILMIINYRLPIFSVEVKERKHLPRDMSCRYWTTLGVYGLISVTLGGFILSLMVMTPTIIEDMLAIGKLYFDLMIIYFAIRLFIGLGKSEGDDNIDPVENQTEDTLITETLGTTN